MKVKFIAVLVLFISLLFFRTKKQDNTIIIYSSMEQFRNDELQVQLEDKFPNVESKVMFIPTGKAAAKVVLEKEKMEAAIIVDLETGYMKKVSPYMADISGLSKIDYLDEFNPELNGNKYLVWERFAGAFIVNMGVIEKYDLDIPKTYDDLLDEQYKGLIAMPDPKSSGTGYFFLRNRVNELGVDGALEYFNKLEANVKQFTESGSGPIKLLNQEEIAVGLGMTFQAVNGINEGKPFEIVYPPQGSPYSLSGTGIIDGRQDDDTVQAIFDFIVNDFILYDKEFFSPEGIYKGQINAIENYPQDINYADMEGIENIEEKEELLGLWNH